MRLFKAFMEYIKNHKKQKEERKMAIGNIKFVDKKGAVYAQVYDTEGNLLKESEDWLTNSLDSMEFSRDTKRCIKVWGPDGGLKAIFARGTLAPYWDAAQVAKK